MKNSEVDFKDMKISQTMSCTEIFQSIGKRQIQALMFHDQMYDLYDFLNLPGFKQWHRHQYMAESKEFLNTKKYFMSTHNKLLNLTSAEQPDSVIPASWYSYTRFDVTSQLVRQHTETSFNDYRCWEEDTKLMYQELSKMLLDTGHVADANMVDSLIADVTSELEALYDTLLRLKATNYDSVYILDIQDSIYKKYK